MLLCIIKSSPRSLETGRKCHIPFSSSEAQQRVPLWPSPGSCASSGGSPEPRSGRESARSCFQISLCPQRKWRECRVENCSYSAAFSTEGWLDEYIFNRWDGRNGGNLSPDRQTAMLYSFWPSSQPTKPQTQVQDVRTAHIQFLFAACGLRAGTGLEVRQCFPRRRFNLQPQNPVFNLSRCRPFWAWSSEGGTQDWSSWLTLHRSLMSWPSMQEATAKGRQLYLNATPCDPHFEELGGIRTFSWWQACRRCQIQSWRRVLVVINFLQAKKVLWESQGKQSLSEAARLAVHVLVAMAGKGAKSFSVMCSISDVLYSAVFISCCKN